MKFYEVGGCVRDELLGVPSKDIDFTVVLADHEKFLCAADGIEPFDFMSTALLGMGFEIFLETPEFLTVRARFPKKEVKMNVGDQLNRFHFANPGLTADFVLARKESDYTDGRRPDKVVPGTLEDDLARRDFTMNAIAKDVSGVLIDPFNGVEDIKARIIRAVGDPMERLTEDALRAVRAVRFAVTKNFAIEENLARALQSRSVTRAIEEDISDERIQVELSKMFRFDTVHSMWILGRYPRLTEAMFSGTVSLDATMKTKGFNKPKPDSKPKLPVAHNGCQCRCHKEPHVMHISACCRATPKGGK